MTDKELRRLSRGELLEMLIAQAAENDQLKNRLEQAEAQLRDRKIAINNAGSLAEAALSLNGVFQAAEAAAQQYLENIERISGQQDAICRDMKEQAKQEAAEIRQEAEAYRPKSTRGCGCLLEAGRCQSVQTAGRPGSTAAIDSVRWRG